MDMVRHIMTEEVFTVQVDQKLSEVRRLLMSKPFHHVPVLRGEVLVGILSSQDIYRASLGIYEKDPELEEAYLDATHTIEQLMTREPEALYCEDSIMRAASILGDGVFHSLPVIDREGRLKGLITSTDLIRYLFERHGG